MTLKADEHPSEHERLHRLGQEDLKREPSPPLIPRPPVGQHRLVRIGKPVREQLAQLPRVHDLILHLRRDGLQNLCGSLRNAEGREVPERVLDLAEAIGRLGRIIMPAVKRRHTGQYPRSPAAGPDCYPSRDPGANVSQMAASINPALRAVSDAVLAVASQLSVDEVLQQLVERARELAHARYAALGIPDGQGGFRSFLVAGMTDELIAAMGPLPRTHGMLGAMLDGDGGGGSGGRGSYRTEDIHGDPRFRGWWPDEHPDMHSFLGVPIIARGEVIGAFYLTEKDGADRFDEGDEALIELLAAHAAIAITNARLYEESRELSIVSERNRLALELHDVVSQKLFSLMLGTEVIVAQIDRDPAAAQREAQRVKGLAREALDELRSLIMGLRPPELERDGLDGAIRKELELLGRLHDVTFELEGRGNDGELDEARAFAALRIVHEALQNAVRHAGASRIAVRLSADAVEVSDDGAGFDPDCAEVRSRHLGLTSMEERARELGGRLQIRSSEGAGTTVRLQLPPRT